MLVMLLKHFYGVPNENRSYSRNDVTLMPVFPISDRRVSIISWVILKPHSVTMLSKDQGEKKISVMSC